MAPIGFLLSATITLTSQSLNTPQQWAQYTTTSTGSSTMKSTNAFRVGQSPATFADTMTLPTIAAVSTPLSSSSIASSAAAPITNPSLELRDISSSCAAGFVPCTSPGGIVCVDSAQFGICATDNCAKAQDLAAGVECKIFSPQEGIPTMASASASASAPLTGTTVGSTPLSSIAALPSTTPLSSAVIAATTSAPPASSAADKIQSKPTDPINWAGYPNTPDAPQYTLFTGNGSTFPDSSAWISSFDDMWTWNMNNLTSKVCAKYGPPNTDAESATVKAAILDAAKGSKLDARFILALVMQESRGCVRVPPTMGAHSNPGLLQDYDGPNSCNGNGTVTTPCPDATIQGMVNDGVFGNQGPGQAKGDGLMQDYQSAGDMKPVSDAARYYITARIYNSGSYVDNDMGCGVATHCYSSDVANRLIGYTGDETPCTPEKVMANCPSS